MENTLEVRSEEDGGDVNSLCSTMIYINPKNPS